MIVGDLAFFLLMDALSRAEGGTHTPGMFLQKC
jgi:hypothetical protein